MRRLNVLLIIILFACVCLPQIAGAILAPNDTDLVTVTAVQHPDGSTYLMYRVFARQATPLPATVELRLESGATPTDVQESNGIEWWKATYVQDGNVLLVNLTRGRIAEVHVRTDNLFTSNGDGTVTAVVPLSAQRGVINVQPGATCPPGSECISPERTETNSDIAFEMLVSSIYLDMSASGAPENATFVFGEQGSTVTSDKQITAPEEEAPKGQCCWWPLVVLSVIFVILCGTYWIVKSRDEEVDEPSSDQNEEQ